MNRLRLLALLATTLTIPLSTASAATKPLDPTVGLCTREADLNKALATIDPLIQKLTATEGEGERTEIGRRIADEHGKGRRIEALIRYREPAMKHVFLPLLEAEAWPIRARALFGLKVVGDESVVEAVAACLTDEQPQIRELAANALCHIAKEVPKSLEKAHAAETDRFVKASMAAAISVIESGKKPYKTREGILIGPDTAQRVRRAWAMKGAASSNKYDAKTLDYPDAKSFDWPISWYEGSLFFKTPRQSFGAKGNHAGEDMAWFREGASIYAVADGLVRMVQGPGGDWGFLIAVEHRLSPHEYVMAVYGHIGFDILVKPGDVVKKGQKIGTVGMSCSAENGGYGAHLHFGLSQGPFRRPTNMRRGVKINLQMDGKNIPSPVLRLSYVPDKKDENGFPGLGMVVRFPDGTNKLVPGPMGKLQQQVSWMQGYVKGCVGWLHPQKFIEAKMEAKKNQ